MNDTGTAARWLTLDPNVRLYRSSDDGAIHVVNRRGQRFSCTADALALFEALRRGVQDTGSCSPAVTGLLLGLEEHAALAMVEAPPTSPLAWTLLPPATEGVKAIGQGVLGLGLLYAVTLGAAAALHLAGGTDLFGTAWWRQAPGLALAVVYVPLWILVHEGAHAAMARRVGLRGGKIHFWREGRWAPRFVAGEGAGLVPAPRKIAVYLAGPALDAGLTVGLVAILGFTRAPLAVAWLGLHLGFAIFNLLPTGRSDAARALAAMAAGPRRPGWRRVVGGLRWVGFGTAAVVGLVLLRLLFLVTS